MCNIIKYKMELLFCLSSSSSHGRKHIQQCNIIPEQTVYQTIRNTLSTFTILDSNLTNFFFRKSVFRIHVCVYSNILHCPEFSFPNLWAKTRRVGLKSHIPWRISKRRTRKNPNYYLHLMPPYVQPLLLR